MSKIKKPETRHIKKFMDGRATPQEVHRALGFRGRGCNQCGAPAAIRIKVLVQLPELAKRNPEFVAQIMATNPEGPFVPTVATKFGHMVKVSDIFACDLCKVDAEKAAAKGPSWCLVEVDRGPDNPKVISSGSGASLH